MKNINKLLLTMVLTLSFASTFAMANPASVKCETYGGNLTIVTDSSGAQSGVCTFTGGVSCDEWAYFRGECSSTGTVEEPKMCTMEYAPVCAEVQVQCFAAPCPPLKQTFGNKCEMGNSSNVKYLYDGECKADTTTVEEPTMCTMEYAPVCGVDGKTYGNKCTAGKHDIAYTGECKKVEVINGIKVSKETSLVKVDVDVPFIGNLKTDSKVYDYVKNYLKTFLTDVATEKLSENWKYEVYITGEAKKVGSIYTYKLEIYTFAGGAHGNTQIKTFNFTKGGTEILIKNKNFLKKVSDTSMKYFTDLLDKGDLGSDAEWLKTGLEPKYENYQNWLLAGYDKNSLSIIFYFPQYQIASYADGIKLIKLDISR